MGCLQGVCPTIFAEKSQVSAFHDIQRVPMFALESSFSNYLAAVSKILVGNTVATETGSEDQADPSQENFLYDDLAQITQV